MKKINKQVLDVPNCLGITVTVYGVNDAKSYSEIMEQGYFISLNGKPIARAELTQADKIAVDHFMVNNFPQHALI